MERKGNKTQHQEGIKEKKDPAKPRLSHGRLQVNCWDLMSANAGGSDARRDRQRVVHCRLLLWVLGTVYSTGPSRVDSGPVQAPDSLTGPCGSPPTSPLPLPLNATAGQLPGTSMVDSWEQVSNRTPYRRYPSALTRSLDQMLRRSEHFMPVNNRAWTNEDS